MVERASRANRDSDDDDFGQSESKSSTAIEEPKRAADFDPNEIPF
jgi:hypothetical protein